MLFRSDGKCSRVCVFGCDNGDNIQPILAGKIKVTLVVGGAAENRTRSVIHQNKVGDKNGQCLAVNEGVANPRSGIDPGFFGRLNGRLTCARAATLGNEALKGRIVFGKLNGQGMVGRQRTEGRAEDGIGAGGVNFKFLVAVFDVEKQIGAFGP